MIRSERQRIRVNECVRDKGIRDRVRKQEGQESPNGGIIMVGKGSDRRRKGEVSRPEAAFLFFSLQAPFGGTSQIRHKF